MIAPSSGFLEPSVVDRGLHVLRDDFGLECVVAPGVREIRGYLAGDDRRRADDLLWALGADDIDAVWCARGGYGAQRTVAAVDGAALDALTGRPARVFVGFSDITVLHALIAFFEDVHETPLSIDRYLSQLLAAGCFDGCAGIVIGDHTDVHPRTAAPSASSRSSPTSSPRSGCPAASSSRSGTGRTRRRSRWGPGRASTPGRAPSRSWRPASARRSEPRRKDAVLAGCGLSGVDVSVDSTRPASTLETQRR
ncbi:MAG TPA: LD-carboxypeptidase [Acidimicrobiales bacterium]|nr:LD-carboxypeptidase [Acidimicrobiales bacterium]